MSASIETFALNSTFDEITLDITSVDSGEFYKVLFYTKDTFKEALKAIDLSDKLVKASATENLTITAEDVNLTKFLGVYFVEVYFQTDCDDVEINPGEEGCSGDKSQAIGALANLTAYQECLLDKALSINVDSCDIQDGNNGYAVKTLMDAFDLAFTQKYYQDSIKLIERLDALCKTCSTCPDYGSTVIVSGSSYQTSDDSIILG